MTFSLYHSVSGLEARVEGCDARLRSEVSVFKSGLFSQKPTSHVSFAGSGSHTSSAQARETAELLLIGARIADEFDGIDISQIGLGKTTIKYDVKTGLEFRVIADSRYPLDQAKIFNDLLTLLAKVTGRTSEALFKTAEAESWQAIRCLPAVVYVELVKHASARALELLL